MKRLPLILFVVAMLAVVASMLRPESGPEPAPDEPGAEEFEEFAAPGLVDVPDRLAQADGATTDEGTVRRLRASGGERTTGGRSTTDVWFAWMKENQKDDGNWESEYDGRSRPAVTGLVILSHLGAGETHKHGNHRRQIKNGLRWLKQIQRPDGGFGEIVDDDYAANHAIATLAMCEAYLMTGSPLFKQSAQHAIDHMTKREISRIWEIIVYRSAVLAKLRVPTDWEKKALAWLDSVTNAGTGVATWASGGMIPDSVAGQTAAAAFGRVLAGEDAKKSEVVARAMEFVIANRPAKPEDVRDPGLLLFGSLAAWQCGGQVWKAWNKPVIHKLLDGQVREGEAKGTWNPWGDSDRMVGRAGLTAMMLMCLEVYYRYDRNVAQAGRAPNRPNSEDEEEED